MDQATILADIESGLNTASAALATAAEFGLTIPGLPFIEAGMKIASAGLLAAQGPTPEALAAAQQTTKDVYAQLDATA